MPRWLKFALVLVVTGFVAAFQTSNAVVRAVLFYSPTCPHCHLVMTETLPPLMTQYGDQLQIVAVDTTTTGGQGLYRSAIQTLDIPEERRGVPTLIVGKTVLVGSYEIPALFPGLVDAGLAKGGVAWPDIPGLQAALPADLGGVPEPATSLPEGIWARFSQDMFGNGLAVLVLLATLGALVWGVARHGDRSEGVPSHAAVDRWRYVAISVLAIAGASISVYLTYIESSGNPAFCGPIGDCNAVQQSEYARLLGVLPIGVLGVIGYGLVLAVHLYRRGLKGSRARRAHSAVYFLTLIGTAFSAYLTFLEPFVIGAVCIWCLTSAVLMAALLGLTAGETSADPHGTPRGSLSV